MRLIRNFFYKPGKISYSQCGEDLIVEFIFEALNIKLPSYIDIGAYHPIHFNNTYLFYKKGGQGVCVEPNPVLCTEIKKERERDICLNAGVGPIAQNEADFYVMSSTTLSTFAKEQVEAYQNRSGQKVEQVIQIPLISVNDIIKEYFVSGPNFISLDIEGLDEEVLKSFDFSQLRPEIFCIETLIYVEDKSEQKIESIIDLMHQNGYFTYADTYINTIFVDQQAWKNRAGSTRRDI